MRRVAPGPRQTGEVGGGELLQVTAHRDKIARHWWFSLQNKIQSNLFAK